MGTLRKELSIKGLLELVHNKFSSVKEINNGRSNKISSVDCLMSGLALFSLKFPSLLKFDTSKAEDKTLVHNLKKLFKINIPISDTQVRTRLDDLDPLEIRKPFKSILAALQRGNILKKFKYINGTYLLANDATGFFSSKTVHCDNCCEKHHKQDDSTTYYHNMLCGAIVHPDIKEVIPLAPEAILQQDGCTKNDCELNSIQRFLSHVRREHPHLPLTVVEDALYSKGPHIKLLMEHCINYIIVVKEKDHKYLFDAVEHGKCSYHTITDENGTIHEFKYINQVPLNYANYDLLVNFVEYWETSKSGKKQRFSWVTDHEITDKNLFEIMKGGRARWHIENETFNTLKNQGYHFEHNFGHGYKNLSTIFAMLMLLAFFIDQTQSISCTVFNAAKDKIKRKSYLWERIRNIFQLFLIESWEELFSYIIHKPMVQLPTAQAP